MAVSDVVEAVLSLSTEERLQLKILVNFNDVVEAVKSISLEEKQQLLLLLQHYIREERREEIYQVVGWIETK